MMANETPTTSIQPKTKIMTTNNEKSKTSPLIQSSGSVWCVVCQGGDEISEPVLIQDDLTEAAARKIADASTQSMWAITMAWPKARYDAWKKHRAELWARMRGNAPEKLVIYSTPNGGESPFYRAWMDSQNSQDDS